MRHVSISALALPLALAACASNEAPRAQVPDRPQPWRPDGVTPDGVSDMRETLAAQRAETRESLDAITMRDVTMGTEDPNATPWYESVLEWIPPAVFWAHWW